jgi:CRP-like cAMP-binding protein
MSFRLKEAVYKIRCREPGCTFTSEFNVKENLMGVTEADVDSEAIKIAKNMAFIKHDALLGRKHQLANPEVFKISSSYDRIGGMAAESAYFGQAASSHEGVGRAFRKGDVILRKHEDSALVVEVLRGSAQNAGHPGLRYRPGAMIGSASLFHQKSRPVDIIAVEDNTAVIFHDIRELTHSNSARAKELYDRALEDVFHVLMHLEDSFISLEKKLKKLESSHTGSRPARVVKKRAAPIAQKRTAKPSATRKRPAAKARRF